MESLHIVVANRSVRVTFPLLLTGLVSAIPMILEDKEETKSLEVSTVFLDAFDDFPCVRREIAALVSYLGGKQSVSWRKKAGRHFLPNKSSPIVIVKLPLGDTKKTGTTQQI